jgi:hypothetical protein
VGGGGWGRDELWCGWEVFLLVVRGGGGGGGAVSFVKTLCINSDVK